MEDVFDRDAVIRGALTPALSQGEMVKEHGPLAVFKIADVALDELEIAPLFRGYQTLHLIQVALVAGGKVVQANHALVEFEQGL